MSFDARKTIIGLTGAHFLQKLVPSLKIKKDVLPRRKTGASGLGEIDMSSSMTVENVERGDERPLTEPAVNLGIRIEDRWKELK